MVQVVVENLDAMLVSVSRIASFFYVVEVTMVQDVLRALEIGRTLVVELRLIRFAHSVENDCWTGKS